ncbi:hypothetical protein MGLY_10410 [Neomoorella glycerini]|uniref:Head fiber protein n=1 Tax=Neomoorella glycerini TaxID=55779 RepID=A0A6I5ZQ22_9FIRM|nr:head fiber protein [Moorella glycerini]QGP91699.1 hypothetical protein MGLY_10410 [Moorella glycerini]
MPTYNPILTITLTPAGVIAPHRFVNFAGGQAGAGQAARGVTHDGAEAGEKAVAVIALGTAIVEAGGAINTGDPLTADANGKAVVVTDASGAAINAIAVGSTAADGDLVEVIVVSPVAKATMTRAAAQANSTAADVATIVADFNALLAKLRAAGIMAQ